MTKLHVMGLFVAALALGTFLFTGCCGGAGDALEEFAEESAEQAVAEAVDNATSGAKKYCNNIESMGQCNVYTPETFSILGEETFKGLCELAGGTWVTTECPTENQVGICDDSSGLFTHYYSTGKTLNYTAETAKKDCEDLDGKFSEK
jgi:hypothetical protein